MCDAMGACTTVEWHSSLSLPISVSDALNRVSRYEYDERGNLVRETTPAGETTEYERDERGLVSAIRDANGGLKRLQYDERGQLVRYTDCSEQVTILDYDADGRVFRVTNALGQQTNFEYNTSGRLDLMRSMFSMISFCRWSRLSGVNSTSVRGMPVTRIF